jgi:hypothetical protein
MHKHVLVSKLPLRPQGDENRSLGGPSLFGVKEDIVYFMSILSLAWHKTGTRESKLPSTKKEGFGSKQKMANRTNAGDPFIFIPGACGGRMSQQHGPS